MPPNRASSAGLRTRCGGLNSLSLLDVPLSSANDYHRSLRWAGKFEKPIEWERQASDKAKM